MSVRAVIEIISTIHTLSQTALIKSCFENNPLPLLFSVKGRVQRQAARQGQLKINEMWAEDLNKKLHISLPH